MSEATAEPDPPLVDPAGFGPADIEGNRPAPTTSDPPAPSAGSEPGDPDNRDDPEVEPSS